MRRQLSRLAATVGMAAGIAVIGGSIIGGIALATDHGEPSGPAVSEVSGSSDDADGTSSAEGDDADSGDEGSTVEPDPYPSGPDDESDHDGDDDAEDDHPDDEDDHEEEHDLR